MQADSREKQELRQRVIIINKGKIIEDGSLDERIDKIASYRHLIIEVFAAWTTSQEITQTK